GQCAILAAGESVEHRFLPRPVFGGTQPKDDAASGDARINSAFSGFVAAVKGGAIEVAGGVSDQIASSNGTVAASGKSVENGLRVLRQRGHGEQQRNCYRRYSVSCVSALMR